MKNVSRASILEYGQHLSGLAGNDAAALRQRIALLSPEERALAELAAGGASHRQIATLIKCTPGSVTRRLGRLRNRLHDPRVVALLHPECPLDAEYRQVGVERILLDHSLRELAARHEVSDGEIRRRLDAVDFWFHELLRHRNASSASRRDGVGGSLG
jgi:DNA-directed RNA polymerase specialized sigma24 family protein